MSPAKSDKAKPRGQSDHQSIAGIQCATLEEMDRLIREFSELKPSDRVLDVACGDGRLSFELAPYCAYLTGVDISEDMIALASERAIETGTNNMSFQIGDAHRLEFTDGMFDKVFCRIALHHFQQPLAALREMVRVVRSPGHLVIADIVSSEDPAWREAHNRIERSRDPSHVTMLSPRQLREALSQIGVSIERETMCQMRQRFGEWMRRAGADRSTTERTRRLMQEAGKKKTTDLDITAHGNALEFTHRWMVCLALKLT